MSTVGEYICQLSAEEKAYVAANLNETDETRPSKIAEVKQWIIEGEELNAPTDDFFILRFLRACKFNVDKTKSKLRNYYKQRANLPDWYGNRDPFLPELQELFDLGVFLPLRKLDNEGRMVVIIRATSHTPSRHKISDMLKVKKSTTLLLACDGDTKLVSLMILDLALRDHESVTVHGITGILDIEEPTYEHVLQLSPMVIKNLVHAWQGCYPVRIHSLDFINAPRIVNAVLNVFRRFMTAKLRQRMHVHARGKLTLYATLPLDILPMEYGGTDGTIRDISEYWKRAVRENREWFAEDEKYKLTLIK